MPIDIQSIAVVTTSASMPRTVVIPPIESSARVRITKNVWAVVPAVVYAFLGILCGRNNLYTVSLNSM